MFNLNDYTLAQQRHEEQSRQAELLQEQRQAANQGAEDQELAPFYAGALAKTGHLMVQVGEALQNRYGSLVEDAQQMGYDSSQKTKPRVQTS